MDARVTMNSLRRRNDFIGTLKSYHAVWLILTSKMDNCNKREVIERCNKSAENVTIYVVEKESTLIS